MTQYVRLENNRVVELLNTTIDGVKFKLEDMFHSDFLANCTFIEYTGTVELGYIYENGKFVEPEPIPEEVLERERVKVLTRSDLTLKQLVYTLYSEDYITEQEVEDWLAKKGLPAFLTKLVSGLPTDLRIDAKITLMTMTKAVRTDPLFNILIEKSEEVFGKKITDEDIDLFWVKALSK